MVPRRSGLVDLVRMLADTPRWLRGMSRLCRRQAGCGSTAGSTAGLVARRGRGGIHRLAGPLAAPVASGEDRVYGRGHASPHPSGDRGERHWTVSRLVARALEVGIGGRRRGPSWGAGAGAGARARRVGSGGLTVLPARGRARQWLPDDMSVHDGRPVCHGSACGAAQNHTSHRLRVGSAAGAARSPDRLPSAVSVMGAVFPIVAAMLVAGVADGGCAVLLMLVRRRWCVGWAWGGRLEAVVSARLGIRQRTPRRTRIPMSVRLDFDLRTR